MRSALFGAVEEPAAVGKAVGRDVEDPRDLRLVEPHGPLAELHRRMRRAQRGPLVLGIVAKLGGKPRESLGRGFGGEAESLDHLPAAPHDRRETVRVDQPTREADGVALLALRARREADRHEVEAVGHAEPFIHHCERSEAIHRRMLDCRATYRSLAMTEVGTSPLRSAGKSAAPHRSA